MSWLCEIMQNTTFVTVISGVLVFILGQIFIEFVLKPIRKYKELKADTAFCLRFYRAKFINCSEDEAAQKAAKELAAKFIAYLNEKPWWLFSVTKRDLLTCCEQFTMLYHCTTGHHKNYDDALESEKTIAKILNLYGFMK